MFDKAFLLHLAEFTHSVKDPLVTLAPNLSLVSFCQAVRSLLITERNSRFTRSARLDRCTYELNVVEVTEEGGSSMGMERIKEEERTLHPGMVCSCVSGFAQHSCVL
jgi:hypothetical protein